jgi:thiamine kinase-like enzyme
LEQTLQITEAVARIQAWGLRHSNWQDRVGDMKQFKEMFQSFTTFARIGMQKTKELYPGKFDNLDVEETAKFVNLNTFLEISDSHLPFMASVLVHGDIWSNNVMFEKLPDGSIGNQLVAIVDWQLIHAGNPMEDFSRLLTSSVHSSVLENDLETILKRYYEVLQGAAGDKFNVPYDTMKQLMGRVVALSCCFLVGSVTFTLQELGKNYEDKKGGEEEMIRRVLWGIGYIQKNLL